MISRASVLRDVLEWGWKSKPKAEAPDQIKPMVQAASKSNPYFEDAFNSVDEAVAFVNALVKAGYKIEAIKTYLNHKDVQELYMAYTGHGLVDVRWTPVNPGDWDGVVAWLEKYGWATADAAGELVVSKLGKFDRRAKYEELKRETAAAGGSGHAVSENASVGVLEMCSSCATSAGAFPGAPTASSKKKSQKIKFHEDGEDERYGHWDPIFDDEAYKAVFDEYGWKVKDLGPGTDAFAANDQYPDDTINADGNGGWYHENYPAHAKFGSGDDAASLEKHLKKYNRKNKKNERELNDRLRDRASRND